MTLGLLSSAAFTAAFAMLARRLTSSVLTAPMMFNAFGLVLSQLDLFPHSDAEEILHPVAATGDCAEIKPIATSAKPLVTQDP